MGRLLLEKGLQERFLYGVHQEGGLSWQDIARFCNVCDRTVRDWRREKLKMRYDAAVALHKKTNVILPKIRVVLPEYWYTKKAGRKGALKRYEKYGNPGTQEGRRKGGLVSQRIFRLDPQYAKRSGVIIRKKIKRPPESGLLAEFVGILLGDGGISDYQARITFNRVTDKLHSKFIQEIVQKLFNTKSTVVARIDSRADDIIISSRSLVEFLLGKGLKIGSKIRNNIDIPRWVYKKYTYKISCLRGLIDTDGSFYLYRHKVGGRYYINFSMCFTNHCMSLLESVYNLLLFFGFKAVKSRNHIYLNKKMDLIKYFGIINTHNPKHFKKYKKFEMLEKLKK